MNEDHSIGAKIFEKEVNCSLKGKMEKLNPFDMQCVNFFVTKGHKHTKPPNIVVTSIIFLQLTFW